jgi:hypothetical protein
MADYTTYRNGTAINLAAGTPAPSFPMHTVWENTFDAALRPMAISDTCTAFMTIPANTVVQQVYIEILTAQATVTVDVGDATDPNGYVTAQVGTVAGVFAGGGAYATAIAAAAGGKLYTVDTALQFTIAAAAAATLKFRVVVVGFNIG